MKDGLSIKDDNNAAPATNLNKLTQAYAAEREKSARRKLIRQLASHLSMVFHINPQEQSLVITFCDGNANNNLGALKYWIEMKLTDENAAERAGYWENELAAVLNEITSVI